ncbi:MAG: hypothetical protein E7213_03285 [Clostridium sp.]|jgi:hypothetical protein|nr:hypothetical protein [Clostridium sp.]
MNYDNNKLQPWIQFTRFFESISCITRLSAHNFKNDADLNKKLRDFYISIIDIDNAFTRTCYEIRNGKNLNIDLDNFNIPTLDPNTLNNIEELKKLFSETIVETEEPLTYILNDVPENTDDKFSYLKEPIKNFLSSVKQVNTIL